MHEITARKQQLEEEKAALETEIPQLEAEKLELERERADLRGQLKEVEALEEAVDSLRSKKESLKVDISVMTDEKNDIISKATVEKSVPQEPESVDDPGAALGTMQAAEEERAERNNWEPTDRPDGLVVTVTGSGVNEIRQVLNDNQPNENAHLAILDKDEIEIRVYTREDLEKYTPLTETADIVGNLNPPPSWNQATQYTQEWLDGHEDVRKMRITVFDPYGFMEQFEGLNIVKTITEHEWWRTDEGMEILTQEETERQNTDFDAKEAATPTFWSVILDAKKTFMNSRSLFDIMTEAMAQGSPHPARVMDSIKEGITIEYLDGKSHPYPICSFQFEGDDTSLEHLKVGVGCAKGQRVRFKFIGSLPASIGKQFMERDEAGTTSPTDDTGNAQIAFQSNSASKRRLT